MVSRDNRLEQTKSAILPELLELTNDEECLVRLAGMETVVKILSLLDDGTYPRSSGTPRPLRRHCDAVIAVCIAVVLCGLILITQVNALKCEVLNTVLRVDIL